jgi:probable F420-dependent oxidoreductase
MRRYQGIAPATWPLANRVDFFVPWLLVCLVVLPFGLGLPVVQQLPDRAQEWERRAGGAELVRTATTAERLGFAHVSCSDHVLVPCSRAAEMGAPWYDAAVTLAFLGGATSRIELLSHVLILPYRHPLVVAKAFGTLDRLTNGRLVMGVGSGHLKPEFKVLGVPYERRGALTDEYMQAIRAAWASDVARFEGPTIRFADVRVEPRPGARANGRPGPPIWIGGNSMAAVRRAARHGDGWIPWRVTPAEFAVAVGRAREIARAARREERLEFVAPLTVSTSDGRSAVCQRVDEWQHAGATRFHVGFAHRSFEEFLARIEWFSTAVIPRFAEATVG